MIRALCLALSLAAAPLAAMAHNVVASVFASGAAIEGEIGFSNGEMAVDQLVEAFDESGAKLGETRTDGEGYFTFVPTAPVAHVFRANMGAGHIADVTMPAGEVAEILAVAAAEAGAARSAAATASLSGEERAAIAEIVRREMRPLRQEIASYRNHNDIQTILGGVGYIAGLFGLGFYLAARRRLAG